MAEFLPFLIARCVDNAHCTIDVHPQTMLNISVSVNFAFRRSFVQLQSHIRPVDMSKAILPVESLGSFAIPLENLISYLPASNYGKLGSILALAVAIYFLDSILHHLCLSPIAGFPGPKIAAATGWYEFYYEYFVNGTYYLEIEKMHQIYGSLLGKEESCIQRRRPRST